MRGVFCLLVVVGTLSWPAFCRAQEKNAIRAKAVAAATQLRSFGEPKDRCSIGALVVEGPVIVRVTSLSTLLAGDKLIALNKNDISAASTDKVVELLRTIEPTAVIPATVERQGTRVDLQIACANARSANVALLAALDAASKEKFDDCVTALDDRHEFGAGGALIRLQCAAVSKNKKRYDIGQLVYEVMRLQVEDAEWTPTNRAQVLSSLRSSEGVISEGGRFLRYAELIKLTQNWTGDENAYAQSEPDWQRFRTAAENAVTARLIDPDSARIEWPYGFLYGSWKPVLGKRIEGYWSCGLINARNRMGGYTGSTFFVVVVDRAGTVNYVELGTGDKYDFLSMQCGKSVKQLPTAPALLRAPRGVRSAAQPVSIADELKTLAELHNSGALSDLEFQDAKAKLLGAPRP